MINHHMTEQQLMVSFNPDTYPNKLASSNKQPQQILIKLPQNTQKPLYHQLPNHQNSYTASAPQNQFQQIFYGHNSSPPRVSYYAQHEPQKNFNPPVVFSYNQSSGDNKSTSSIPKQLPNYTKVQLLEIPHPQSTSYANNTQRVLVNSAPVSQGQQIAQQSYQIKGPQQVAVHSVPQQIPLPGGLKQIQPQFTYEVAPQTTVNNSPPEQIIRNSQSSPQSINPVLNTGSQVQSINSSSQPTFYAPSSPSPNFVQNNVMSRTPSASNHQVQSVEYPQEVVQVVPQNFYQQSNPVPNQRLQPAPVQIQQPNPQQSEYPPQYYNQQQDLNHQNSSLWQQRFNYLYEKYVIFYEKYEAITQETVLLNDQFLKVDSEEQWLALKEKYDQQLESMKQIREEYALTIQQIQASLQQSEKADPSSSGNDEAGRVWQHRYNQLLEQYQSLSMHYAELQNNENQMANSPMEENQRLAMMNQKYAQLQNEYNQVVEQLQNSPNSMQSRQEHEDLLKYTQQLQSYIEQLETQNNNLVGGLKNSVENSKFMDQGQISLRLSEKDNEINNLVNVVRSLEDKLREAEAQSRRKSNMAKEAHTSQLQNQLQEMNAYCSEVQQKLAIKQYENSGLKDKLQYLEQQLQIKNEEAMNNTRLLQQRLVKIEAQILRKNHAVSLPIVVAQPVAPIIQVEESSYKLGEEYENKLKQYQKVITSKNNQIKILEQRVNQIQNDKRTMHAQKMSFIKKTLEQNDSLEDQFRNKIAERDTKIRTLQNQIEELQNLSEKNKQSKQTLLKNFQLQKTKIREQNDISLMQKDTIVKNLQQVITRLENQIKDRNSQLSRIKTPLRNLNNGQVAESAKKEEELRQLRDQLDRKAQETAKIKKQRDHKLHQYAKLEQEYDILQQENNKRRIELNNLKRQLSNVQNLNYQIEDLRSALSKKNQEINELKNGLFEVDRLKLQSQAKNRQLVKLNELCRLNSRQLEELKQANYELSQKLSQKDLKLMTEKIESPLQPRSNNTQQLLTLQQQLRKKQIELSRLKLENEELTRSFKRSSEDFESFKQKYSPKLKQLQDESNELKIKTALLQKRSTSAQSKAKQLQEINKKIKANLTEQYSNQNLRLKQYYVRFLDKQEQQLKTAKQKIRKYEIELHDLQLEIDRLNNIAKQDQVTFNELQRKLKHITDQLQKREDQIKILRSRQSEELSSLRKKQERYIEVEALVKSKDYQMRDLEKKNELLKNNIKLLKKQYDDYKQNVIERMEDTTQQELDIINRQIEDYESKMASQGYNFDFKVRDKKGNQVFERRVIYQLKRENERLQKQLEGRGINIALQKLKITQMQQEALTKSKLLIKKDEAVNSEELDFYKQKNKELEERVNNHIAVNNNLKTRLEYLLEDNTKYEELDKLKSRVLDLEKREREYEQKIAALGVQNSNIKREYEAAVAATQALSQNHQFKIQQYERKANQAALQLNSLRQQIAAVTENRKSTEQKYLQLEKQLVLVTNQYMIVKAELERLKESKNQKQDKSKNQFLELKRKIDELIAQVNNKDFIINTLENALKNKEAILKDKDNAITIKESAIRDKDNALYAQTEKLRNLSSQYELLEQNIAKLRFQLQDCKSKLLHSQRSLEQLQNLRKVHAQAQSSVHVMNQKIAQLQKECSYYKKQSASVNSDAWYYIEFLRSNCLQLQVLAKQLELDNKKMVLLSDKLIENSHRGLESCQYLNEILTP